MSRRDSLPDQSGTVPMVHPGTGLTVQVNAQYAVDTLAAEVGKLQEVVGRLLYRSGSITSNTPCRCGATQPAHACAYKDQAERDALALLPSAGTTAQDAPMAGNPPQLQESDSEQREWTVYICPACGMGPFCRPGDAELHAAVRCEPDAWPWEPVVVVRRDERDMFREALGILAGMSRPETMDRYRREVKRRRDERRAA